MNKISTAVIYIFLLLIVTSVAVTYERYMIREDFTYFESENDLPDPFDKENY